MRADAAGDGVMVVAVPAQRVRTLYAGLGEFVPVVALAFLAMALLLTARALRRRPAAGSPADAS